MSKVQMPFFSPFHDLFVDGSLLDGDFTIYDALDNLVDIAKVVEDCVRHLFPVTVRDEIFVQLVFDNYLHYLG
jgi:hypothetical protein